MYLNTVKTVCDKPTVNVIVNGEKLEAFKLRNKARVPTLTISIHIVLQVLTRVIN